MATCTSVTLVPGPQGPAGTAGVDGEDGLNAYTTTIATFVMPAESANVTVSVASSAWATIGQIVAVKVGGAFGHFEVISKPTAVSIELKNLEVTASGTYASNSPATTSFASGATVSPAGLQGPPGVAASSAPVGATFITQTPNGTLTSEQALSGLATGILLNTTGTGVLSIAAAGTEYLAPAAIGVTVQAQDATLAALAAANWAANALPIGTGVDTLAQTAFAANTFPARASAGNLVAKAITDFALTLLDDAAAANMQTTLGLVIGANVQAFDAFLASIAALGTAADRYLYTTGVDTAAEGVITSTSRALLTNTSIQTWNFALGGLIPRYGRLGSINAVDLNSTADTTLAVDAYVSNARYRIDKIMVENASISLTTVTVGVFTAAGGGGTTIAADQVLSALTASTKWVALTLAAVVGTDVMTASPLYFRVGTPQGAAATANVHLFGWSFDGP